MDTVCGPGGGGGSGAVLGGGVRRSVMVVVVVGGGSGGGSEDLWTDGGSRSFLCFSVMFAGRDDVGHSSEEEKVEHGWDIKGPLSTHKLFHSSQIT